MEPTGDAWSLFDGDDAAPAPVTAGPPVAADAADPDAPAEVAAPELGPERLRLGAAVPLSYTLRPLIDFFMQHARHTIDDLTTLAAPAPAAAAADPAVEGAAELLDALKAAHAAVTELDACRRKANKAGTKRGPTTTAALAANSDAEAAALDQLHGAGDALVDTAWAWLRERKSWPHVAWREAFVHGQLCRSVAVSAGGDPLAGMQAVDLALIMGAPAPELEGLVAALEMACTVVKAANAAADGAAAAAAPAAAAAAPAASTDATAAPPPTPSAPPAPSLLLPVIPPVLGPDAAVDLPSLVIPPEHTVPRLAAMTTGPARKPAAAAAPPGGEAAAAAAATTEHSALAALRAITEGGAGGSTKPLSLPDFRKRFVKAGKPVVLAGVGRNWAALDTWRDLPALVAQFGHRTVPVEIGQHLSGSWREEPMTLAAFVGTYVGPSVEWGWGTRVRVVGAPALPLPADDAAAASVRRVHPSAVAYLAQHDLFGQLPGLASGGAFEIPVYAGNEVGAINAWFGTAGEW
jgi:hypothetical protein